jgi:hypothetical protein
VLCGDPMHSRSKLTTNARGVELVTEVAWGECMSRVTESSREKNVVSKYGSCRASKSQVHDQTMRRQAASSHTSTLLPARDW